MNDTTLSSPLELATLIYPTANAIAIMIIATTLLLAISVTIFDGDKPTITSSNDLVKLEYAVTVPSDTLPISVNIFPAPLPSPTAVPIVIERQITSI